MTLEDEYRYLVCAYYGIREMDEYDLKVYILEDIENYIKDFINTNEIHNFDYRKEAEKVNDETSLKVKLQDSLLVLPKIDAPMELVFLVKQRLEQIKKDEQSTYWHIILPK